ncbi:hypothetical protein ASF10_22095 [Flavobacterium sp. Leaf82]|jgi:tetratricopeptide (TPR) repeat protein|uniref:sulfotransferase family 2 domain-containing protein n=1 Tax=unclassified Flavobacterium TaxID=196869 RepID=UPI0006FEF095|nr:sulfotransferase family 2 domain-containing protein [Flavobacterium sp. Leaf82]KQO31332.1 hypothetical protein ASF10_22095 [Flavobacterium sp. Leaf82]
MKTKTSNSSLIFTHVPRSGGITLNSILKNNFPSDKQYSFYIEEFQGSGEKSLNKFVSLPIEEKKKIILLNGHTNFGLHEFYDTPCTYTTLFRDPVTRIPSYYNYILKHNIHYLHNMVIKNRMTLKDVLDSKISIEFDNGQVRQISGFKDVKYGKCDSLMLEKAIENLEKHFPVFGLTEKFDESLMLFQKYFNFKSPYYTVLNESLIKNPSPPSQETIKYITDSNYLDVQFYEYALEKFKKLITDYGDNFENDLKNFTKKNDRLNNLKIGKKHFGVQLWQAYVRFESRNRSKV